MLRDIAPRGSHGTLKRARRLRAQMSLPEVLLWSILRSQPGGLKFRRQHPTGPYILDFYCADARLAIEIDGKVHVIKMAVDEKRDLLLAEAGITTMQIPAAIVLKNVQAAAETIYAACLARLPLHHPELPDGPPSRDKLGED